MEAEQQHVYGACMDSVPCGWSARGAEAMARVHSGRASRRELPRLTWEMSVTSKMAERDEARVPLRVGRGREAEHVSTVADKSTAVRYAAGVDSGMVATGW